MIFFSQMRKFLILRRSLINKTSVSMRGHPSKLERKCRVSSADTIQLTWWSGWESIGNTVLPTSIFVSKTYKCWKKQLNRWIQKCLKGRAGFFSRIPCQPIRLEQLKPGFNTICHVSSPRRTGQVVALTWNSWDYSLWAQLESIACAKPHKSVDGLKKAITKAVKNFPVDAIRRSIDDWPS